jgi:hypothetical protein
MLQHKRLIKFLSECPYSWSWWHSHCEVVRRCCLRSACWFHKSHRSYSYTWIWSYFVRLNKTKGEHSKFNRCGIDCNWRLHRTSCMDQEFLGSSRVWCQWYRNLPRQYLCRQYNSPTVVGQVLGSASVTSTSNISSSPFSFGTISSMSSIAHPMRFSPTTCPKPLAGRKFQRDRRLLMNFPN